MSSLSRLLGWILLSLSVDKPRSGAVVGGLEAQSACLQAQLTCVQAGMRVRGAGVEQRCLGAPEHGGAGRCQGPRRRLIVVRPSAGHVPESLDVVTVCGKRAVRTPDGECQATRLVSWTSASCYRNCDRHTDTRRRWANDRFEQKGAGAGRRDGTQVRSCPVT